MSDHCFYPVVIFFGNGNRLLKHLAKNKYSQFTHKSCCLLYLMADICENTSDLQYYLYHSSTYSQEASEHISSTVAKHNLLHVLSCIFSFFLHFYRCNFSDAFATEICTYFIVRSVFLRICLLLPMRDCVLRFISITFPVFFFLSSLSHLFCCVHS